jgi:presequence protease
MTSHDITAPRRIAGFVIETTCDIPELRSTASVYTHEKTGARLFHLRNDDPNNLFSVAFRTPVSDSTGVPHILEHSVLGGSRKFPLKDPFQELLKGSLQTFLNALTYPDKTVYPVSSQVEADFFNLVDVYCDAVFHPLLTENTFWQEGWHFDAESESGPVSIKGIVYNEMKGVFSDFASHVERKTVSLLFPDTSYYYESGGEPEHITDLTYRQFLRFHAQYYNPSNAFIVLYGNLPPEKTLSFLDEKYLAGYDRTSPNASVAPQPSWLTPRRAVLDAPAPEKDDGLATVALAWKFGLSADALYSLIGRVLYRYLMGTESSPLKRALIDSGLGEDLDDICGFESEFVHGIFAVGLRKTKPVHADAIESLVLATLKKEVEKGLDGALLEGAVRQTEFRLREISDAGRFPYNLILAERCYRSWMYGGDPCAHLAFEKPLSIIRGELARGTGWFAGKIRGMLIDNPHYLRLTVRGSSDMGRKLETQTREQALALTKDFSGEDVRRVAETTAKLVAEQKKPNTPEALASLPRLRKSDLPLKNQEVPAVMARCAGAEAIMHPLFTSGIVYLDLAFDCRHVPPGLLMYLPLYAELLPRAGAAGLSYEEMSKRLSLSTGGINGSLLCETAAGAENDLVFKWFLHAKALSERSGEMLGIVQDLLHSPELSNAKQLRDILFEMRNDLNAAIINSGHSFAATHAGAQLARSRFVTELLDGVTQLRFLDKLVKQDDAAGVADKMRALHGLIVNRSACTVSITADNPGAIVPGVERCVASLPSFKVSPVDIVHAEQLAFTGIEISSSVNFVAKAWKLGPATAADTGRALLLARNLSSGYLWDKVRVEGGAYGGMAMAPGGHPVFECASYRDPNLGQTLFHFEKGLQQVAAGLDPATVEQSIIGTIGRIDAPHTPHQKGFGETVALLCGRTPLFRQAVRDSVLSASPESMKDTAQRLLNNPQTAVTALGSAAAFDNAEKEGLFFRREALLEE